MITRQSKLLFVFLSTQNPWWHGLLEPPITQKEITKYLGFSQSTLANWRKGGNVDEARLKETFNKVRDVIRKKSGLSDPEKTKKLKILTDFLDAYNNSEKWHVYDVSEQILGMGPGEDQKILDEVIFSNFSIFPSLSYESERSAEVDFRAYRGLYRAWVRRDDAWLKCALRVRYVLNVQNAVLIRCKLNLPVMKERLEGGDNNYWEYDGFCKPHNNSMFWIFQKRELNGTDLFFFITSRGRFHEEDGKSRTTLCGTYLTTGQDQRRSIVSGDIFLQRIDNEDIKEDVALRRYKDKRISEKTTDVRKWMHSFALPILKSSDGIDYEKIERHWQNASSRDDTPALFSHNRLTP